MCNEWESSPSVGRAVAESLWDVATGEGKEGGRESEERHRFRKECNCTAAMGGHAPGRRAKFRIPPIGASEDGLRSSPPVSVSLVFSSNHCTCYCNLGVVREHSKVRGPAAARPCLRLRDSQGSGELCQGRANGSGLPVSILQRFARQYDGVNGDML